MLVKEKRARCRQWCFCYLQRFRNLVIAGGGGGGASDGENGDSWIGGAGGAGGQVGEDGGDLGGPKPVILARTALVQPVVQEQRNLHLVLVEFPQEQVLQVVFLNCAMG